MKMSPIMVVSNFALFQIGWFACVLSAAEQQPWFGVLVTTGVVVAHVLRAPLPKAELQLVLLSLGLGLAFDSLLVWQGWLQYSSGILLPSIAPYWIVALWGLFATLLNVSLRWMRGRWVIAVVFGAIGGPAAYYGGLRLGALEFTNMPAGLMPHGRRTIASVESYSWSLATIYWKSAPAGEASPSMPLLAIVVV